MVLAVVCATIFLFSGRDCLWRPLTLARVLNLEAQTSFKMNEIEIRFFLIKNKSLDRLKRPLEVFLNVVSHMGSTNSFNIGEKPTVIVYTGMNYHVETPK